MPFYLKIINVFLLSTVRYFFTPILAFLLKLSLFETILTMVSGGIVSFISFYYLTNILLVVSRFFRRVLIRVAPDEWVRNYEHSRKRKTENRKHRKKFTRRNKLIIKTRNVYGFWGIIITTPFLLSLPFGAFLMRRYYHYRKGSLLYSLIAVALEGILFCFLYYLIPGLRTT